MQIRAVLRSFCHRAFPSDDVGTPVAPKKSPGPSGLCGERQKDWDWEVGTQTHRAYSHRGPNIVAESWSRNVMVHPSLMAMVLALVLAAAAAVVVVPLFYDAIGWHIPSDGHRI
ncbi:hypothetical protein KM043_016746 [Ampulex compressa]|nr:hypothetical protein KM043_016746 [Ampulex compressa]